MFIGDIRTGGNEGREADFWHWELVVAHTAAITQAVGTPNLIEWAKLGLDETPERVLRLTSIRYDDNDRPVALEEAVLPLGRFPGLTATGGDIPDIIELGKSHGVSVGRASERVSIVSATKDVASHLEITTGANLLKLDRVVETIDGEPIEWRVTYRKI
jgi:DNA-binding GntR family transcriptional regulator